MRILAILALTLAIAAAPPAARPVGPWVVDFETTHCIASHEFDVGGTSIVFGIEAIPTDSDRYVYFQRPGKLRTMDYESADIRLGGKRIKSVSLLAVPVTKKGNVRYSTNLKPEEYRLLLDGNSISVRSPPVRADLPPMNIKAIEEKLADCSSLMLERWGFSREAQSKVASYPKLKPAKSRMIGGEYPLGALSRGGMGSVRLLLNVDQAGKISNCRVIRSSGFGDLDSDACTAIGYRVEFDPARDRQGHPVGSPFITDYRYFLRVW
jgi:TonB family protein